MRSRSPLVFILLLAGCAPAPVKTGGKETPQTPTSPLCWRSLAPETGEQDLGLSVTESTLAANGSGEVWLGWEETESKVIRWNAGSWRSVSLPERNGYERPNSPLIAASSTGGAVMALRANGPRGTTSLHIARATKADAWEWLGPPRLSSEKSSTHAQSTALAVTKEGEPIVAWTEERDGEMAGLFAERWDGRVWKRLGVLEPQGFDYYLSPVLAVDSKGKIWLAWKGTGGRPHVARWDESAWTDIGLESLQSLAVGPDVFGLAMLVDGRDQPWLFWLADVRDERTLLAARWDGASWQVVPAPTAPKPKRGVVGTIAAIVHKGEPLVAWTQDDESENQRLYVAERAAGERWNVRIAELHLVEGASAVSTIRLAAGVGDEFFIAWDESGKDKRRTRLVRAYECAAGEVPAAPPRSTRERDTWPTTVQQAAQELVREMDEESKMHIRGTAKKDLIRFHHGWGTGIRNGFGLWRGNDKLIESCGKGKRVHPDDCSMRIIEAVWDLLQVAGP